MTNGLPFKTQGMTIMAMAHVLMNGRAQSMTVRCEILNHCSLEKETLEWGPIMKKMNPQNGAGKIFVDSCPDQDNTPMYTGRAENPVRLFKGHEISDRDK